jgi:hypothetical protein
MNGPVTGMYLNVPPSSTAGTADRFSSVEKKMRAWTEVNTASGEFQSMPQRTRSLFESLVCRKVVSAASPMLPR